jgi:hypothetical protein
MSMPHKCPVCNGTGKVSIPPNTPGDVGSWTSDERGPWDCHACKGTGILWEFDPVNIPSVFGIDDALTMKAKITTTKHDDCQYDNIDWTKQELHRMG